MLKRLTCYFSTQGCRFRVSFGAAVLEAEAPLAVAAAARALLSKKLAIVLNHMIDMILGFKGFNQYLDTVKASNTDRASTRLSNAIRAHSQPSWRVLPETSTT